MSHRKCTICGKDVVLIPSTKHRAKKYGGTPQDYLDLFPTHATCAIQKRSAESVEAMQTAARRRDDQRFVDLETRLRHARAH